MMSSADNGSSLHRVNNLLHTLRGEQFRHSQNVRRSRTHLSSSLTHNSPTLPTGLTGLDSEYPSEEPNKDEEDQNLHDSPTWRAHALSIIFARLPTLPNMRPVPPLTLLCLRIIISSFSTAEFTEDLIPFIPPHLRRDLVHYTAVHSPLPTAKLYGLYEPDGHADGELIIVGPQATLRENFFRSGNDSNTKGSSKIADQGETKVERGWNWDSPSHDEETPNPLHTIVILSTRLPVSTVLSLPPTITNMALINLPFPIPLHRLPALCPLIVTLDLSYNTWLGASSKEAASRILERVEWSRWRQLRILGFRDCQISEDIVLKVNKGRWDDVNMILQ